MWENYLYQLYISDLDYLKVCFHSSTNDNCFYLTLENLQVILHKRLTIIYCCFLANFLFVIISFNYLGAVETAKKYKCTPKQVLHCKEFSAGYWNWQHLYLMDAVRQKSWPCGFITINPCEWTFPQVWCNLLITIF